MNTTMFVREVYLMSSKTDKYPFLNAVLIQTCILSNRIGHSFALGAVQWIISFQTSTWNQTLINLVRLWYPVECKNDWTPDADVKRPTSFSQNLRLYDIRTDILLNTDTQISTWQRGALQLTGKGREPDTWFQFLRNILLQWQLNTMADIYQTTISSTYPWKRMFDFPIKFQWNILIANSYLMACPILNQWKHFHGKQKNYVFLQDTVRH